MLDVESLVTLTEARTHLRVGDELSDADIQMKLTQATAMVLDYVGSTAYWRAVAATWTDATVPAYVHAAILLQLADLFTWRGDDVPKEARGEMAPGVEQLLRRTRDPVLA